MWKLLYLTFQFTKLIFSLLLLVFSLSDFFKKIITNLSFSQQFKKNKLLSTRMSLKILNKIIFKFSISLINFVSTKVTLFHVLSLIPLCTCVGYSRMFVSWWSIFIYKKGSWLLSIVTGMYFKWQHSPGSERDDDYMVLATVSGWLCTQHVFWVSTRACPLTY